MGVSRAMSKTTLARQLRLEQTPAERKFWEILHSFRQSGWHFRRQAPIGPYIVDFVSKRAQLVFEIDGESHFTDEGLAHDHTRTVYLETRGYRVMRFNNLDVLTTSEGVYHAVNVALGEAPSP